MDTSWIYLKRHDPYYIRGVSRFIDLAKENLKNGKTLCPCKVCKVERWHTPQIVEDHLVSKGFYTDYDKWIYHGKGSVYDRIVDQGGSSDDHTEAFYDAEGVPERHDMKGLLGDLFGGNAGHIDGEPATDHEFGSFEEFSASLEKDPKYKKLLEAADEALYEGCPSFSKLSFILHLFHLKCMFKWSGQSFTLLLKLILDAFPQVTDFPESYYEGKKLINDLGLGYQKIHACPNDCVLYWGDKRDFDKCPVCNASRWKVSDDSNSESGCKKVAAKVMRYFPLIPRLLRIYRNPKMAQEMRWHEEQRVKDGKLRCPADGRSWQDFNETFPEFASDPRSVRLGLASDGFNPYRLMSTNYSTWPVVLIPYNLPPWLCMKPANFILSVLIPGKSSPGIDIDVYLEPLVDELQKLWGGVPAFDAYSAQKFSLKAALTWTINDFPAYAMLSGWSTKGKKACPICTNFTPCKWFADRMCFIGHRKWLPVDHPLRFQAAKFDGTVEDGTAPAVTSGTDVKKQQEECDYVYGKVKPKKSRKRKSRTSETAGADADDTNQRTWSKKSIFFQLSYWEFVLLRHNLDVMHIEKNVCDYILGTLLESEKSRDTIAVREALKEAGLRPELWVEDGSNKLPPGPFSMDNEAKDRFLRVLQKVKVPDGYGSNLSRCVNLKQRKLINLKSHDNHVLMQDILPSALRAADATEVIDLLSELSAFFKYLCSTTLEVEELDKMQLRIVLVLCEMERLFVPTFFTVMVHLLVHLVDEAKLGGPVQFRWMYPIERYLARLKSYVTNKAQPEGSIAEGYHMEETVTFCSRYMDSLETKFTRPKRNDDCGANLGIYLYESGGRAIGKEVAIKLDAKSVKQAHRYVLIHSDEMSEFQQQYVEHKKLLNGGKPVDDKLETDWLINGYSEWLLNQAHKIVAVDEVGELQKSLAGGLNNSVKSLKGYMINGFKFCTLDKDNRRKTQNSGVMLDVQGLIYYGQIVQILEVDYYGSFKVVLFKCRWADVQGGVECFDNGGVAVTFNKLMHTGRLLRDDPFIFSSQARQVFYIEDEVRKGWYQVVPTKPRDLFEMGDDEEEEE